MSDQVRQNMAADRLIGTLSLIFAALATFLAAIGLYGMLASCTRGVSRAARSQSAGGLRE